MVNGSVAPSTKKIYTGFEQEYLRFCNGLDLPPTGKRCGKSVELWVASLSERHLAYTTILTRLSAIRHMFRRSNLPRSFESDRLRLMLKGLKSEASQRVVRLRKSPVTLSHLRRLGQAADILGSHLALQFKAMIACAFYGFLRPSEYCSTSSNHALKQKDVRFSTRHRDACYLTLHSYKHSQGVATIKVVDMPNAPLKPVSLLRRYVARSPKTASSELLFPVSASEFGRTLKTVAEAANITSKLTPHCLRHEGATWGSKQGWSQVRIQAHGRWKSNAYKTYIQPY